MINIMDLSGEFELYLDKSQKIEFPDKYTDSIYLPDTISHARKGEYSDVPERGFMTDTYKFEGNAWFRRYIDIKEDMGNCCLNFERTRVSTVYLDGVKIGTQNSLCTPHRYNINNISKGRHQLVICVDNVNYPTGGGHMTSPDTQTNWNGVTGKMQLIEYGKSHVDKLWLYPNVDRKSVLVKGNVIGTAKTATLWVEGIEQRTVVIDEGKFEFEYMLGDKFRLWNEYDRFLYTIYVDVEGDIETEQFGLREISAEGITLKVNNKPVFLRGKHDGLVFPLTGFTPTDTNSWLEVLSTAKKYGINHYRFHTCCPPESAFAAADLLGIYMEPELPFWGTITAPGEEGYNEAEQSYLISEGFKILDEFGNHPSFVMMSMGNELWGSTERINDIVGGYKEYDNRHLYTGGSNIFQFVPTILPKDDFFCGVRFDRERLFRGSYAMCDAPQGHIQTQAPNSSHNYDKFIIPEEEISDVNTETKTIEIQYGTGVKKVQANGGEGVLIPDVPVISHEVGQYAMYPSFDEGKLYTGSIKPLYLNIWKESLTKSGLFPLWKEYFKASSTFAMDCYKREIEAALGSEYLSGFQLLDLQDFPGQGVALVGVLNSLMKSKGIISAKEWRCFCSDLVLLCKLDKFVYTAGEPITGEISISSSELPNITAGTVVCKADGVVVKKIDFVKPERRLFSIGSIKISTSDIKNPKKIRLRLELKNTNIYNEYDVWVYPNENVQITENNIDFGEMSLGISRSMAEAQDLLAKGIKTLLIPEADENSIKDSYCTDFWNYPMFSSISKSMNKPLPQGTLGIYADIENPILKSFLSEKHTTANWYNFIAHSHSRPMGANCKTLVEVIDNADRGLRLGLLYEENGIPVCTCRLWEISQYTEIKTLAKGIVLHYGK